MKAVLISINPRWVELIASGKKTIEVRKTRPKLKTPFKCYIYETQEKYKKGSGVFAYGEELTGTAYGRGKVIGEFVCDDIEKFVIGGLRCDDIEQLACLPYSEMIDYFYNHDELGKIMKFGHAWHISDLKIYDKPKELWEFRKPCSGSIHCRACAYSKIEKSDDGFKYVCYRKDLLTRPPKSFMYVEEIYDGEAY